MGEGTKPLGTAEEEGGLYVCDADAVINLWRHFKKMALTALKRLARRELLKIPEGVCREIHRGDGKLKRFMENHRASLEVRIQGPLQKMIFQLERKYGERIRLGRQEYGGFWKSKAGKQAADAQVVAVTKYLSATCVSDDQAVRFACALENGKCIGWVEFARRLGLVRQFSLFDPQ